jgi:Fe-Mn family superoxide dismutase
MIILPALPYAKTDLEPHISEKTISFHYDKHHNGYVTNLNNLIVNTAYADMELEDIIATSTTKAEDFAIFNNAAQVWNHTFYWRSMKADGGTVAEGAFYSEIEKSFGSIDVMLSQFKSAALTQFGSGWAWLVFDKADKALKIVKTSNAQTPLTTQQVPLLTIDVWEHAYYLDFQNLRAAYVDAFFAHLANWDFAAANFKLAQQSA